MIFLMQKECKCHYYHQQYQTIHSLVLFFAISSSSYKSEEESDDIFKVFCVFFQESFFWLFGLNKSFFSQRYMCLIPCLETPILAYLTIVSEGLTSISCYYRGQNQSIGWSLNCTGYICIFLTMLQEDHSVQGFPF